MQGLLETLMTSVLLRGLGPGLLTVLMAAPPRKVARAQLKKIYVLNESGDMAGEYVLDPDCPIDYNDFLKVLPEEGIGDRETLFVGEYVFTAFQSGKFVFVLLSRGQLAPEDFDWTALLLTAADSHLAAAASRPPPVRPPESKPSPDQERALSDREARLNVREGELTKLEVKLKADEANLRGRAEEFERQKKQLAALADYVSQVQQSVVTGVSKANQSLEMMEQLASSAKTTAQEGQTKDLAAVRQHFENERKALIAAKEDLEAKYRDAVVHVAKLEQGHKDALATLEKERTEATRREEEAEKVRAAIETRVQELSGRFAAMAKERLVMSHKGPSEPSGAVKQAIEIEKAQLAKERKFLQRRAIELLDREEQVRDRDIKLTERDHALRQRESEIATREAEFETQKAALAQTVPAAAPKIDVEEARKDIERRVKIIQQKAVELLDREEKLRKRAAELAAMEARLVGRIPAK